jgi:hypothetical protein
MMRFALLFLALPGLAEAACRQALALGLDVSGSVDAEEYRLQLDGLASALNSEAVQEAFFSGPDAPIEVLVYEWSGPDDQTIIVPWTVLAAPDDLMGVTRALRTHSRSTAAPTTAIGAAMLEGFAFLEQRAECWKRTLDLSGDGQTNIGPRPQDIGESRTPTGVIVNGLVIGPGNRRGGGDGLADIRQLSSYYQSNVIRGPDAFVEEALGFEDYAAAMERKLLRELTSLVIGDVAPK